MRNYILYGKTRFAKHLLYAYLDVPEALATSVLLKHDVRAKFVHLLTREDTDYVLVQMKIHRNDRQKFLDAMEDLKTKMLICSHPDYETRAGEFIRELEDDIIEESLQDEKLMKRWAWMTGTLSSRIAETSTLMRCRENGDTGKQNVDVGLSR